MDKIEVLDEVFNVGDKVFYVRFQPTNGIAEIVEMRIVSIDEKITIALINNERDTKFGYRWIISNKYLGDIVFHDRKRALEKLNQMEDEAHYIEKKFTVAEEPYDEEEE